MKTLEDLEKDIGKELTDKILDIFVTEKNAVHWFYNTNLLHLGWISPYEAYKKGMEKEVEELIERIEHGVYS